MPSLLLRAPATCALSHGAGTPGSSFFPVAGAPGQHMQTDDAANSSRLGRQFVKFLRSALDRSGLSLSGAAQPRACSQIFAESSRSISGSGSDSTHQDLCAATSRLSRPISFTSPFGSSREPKRRWHGSKPAMHMLARPTTHTCLVTFSLIVVTSFADPPACVAGPLLHLLRAHEAGPAVVVLPCDPRVLGRHPQALRPGGARRGSGRRPAPL